MEEDFQKEDSSTTTKMINENGMQNGSEIYTKNESYKMKLKWQNIICISLFHLYFVYVCFTFKFFEKLKTTAWSEYFFENNSCDYSVLLILEENI